jgi:hypothetical protein
MDCNDLRQTGIDSGSTTCQIGSRRGTFLRRVCFWKSLKLRALGYDGLLICSKWFDISEERIILVITSLTFQY